MRKFAVIACDVFKEELSSLSGTQPPWQRIEWLEMGLHDQPDALRKKVQAVIDAWDALDGFDAIVLGYGLCGNGLIGIRARSKILVLPRGHDCISILLGGPAAHDAVLKENPGTYFYSPGWIRNRRVPGPDREDYLRAEYNRRYPDDPEYIDDLIEADTMAFSHHNCAAYVDLTQNAEAENYCKNCARHLGWKFRKLSGEPGLLRDLLSGSWDEGRFLIVPTGHSIVRSSGEELVSAAPENLSLADWLARQGHRLNTRCGGRGLCRGCEVELQGEPSRIVKACQTPATIDITGLHIPPSSYADRSLTGVSDFDLQLPSNAARRNTEGFAVAIDIGTTTLAAALWDLSQNICLASCTMANPQRRYGDDVLSRISYSLEQVDGLGQLQRALIDEGLNPLVKKLNAKDEQLASVSTVCMTGNPTMLQTLTGDSLEGLSRYPFRLAYSGVRRLPLGFAGLEFAAEVTLLPALGPFVGADILAGALASGVIEDNRTTLLIDFGTNGEMLLRSGDKVVATATAAGPAFEGGRLRCGSTARANTISSLELVDGAWRCVAGDGSTLRHAQGISGAAYIDFLALAVTSGLLSEMGRFNRQHRLWKESGRTVESESAVYLDARNFITEADIAELLQAKAATGAGLKVLMEEAGVSVGDLDRVLVAGGFGYHLNPRHARRIGLLPNVTSSRIHIVGNASLAGASLALQYNLDDRIAALQASCRCIELNQISTFADYYSDCMALEYI
jgi:uncharacterized 2Fe-2S/4Fe-4S cluster protein (DUF4445 family)